MRKIALAILFLCLCTVLSAKHPLIEEVFLSLNSENGQYAKGDSVKVWGRLLGEYDKALTLEVLAAGRSISKSPVSLSTSDSTLVYCGVWNEAKSVMLKVYADEPNKVFTDIGFIVAPEEFRPGFEEPEDLIAYWDSEVRALRKSKAKVKTMPVNCKFRHDDKVVCYEIEISMPEGNPVRGFVAMPKDAAKKSLPIFFYTHAAGVKGSWCKSTPDMAASLALRGNGAIGIDINAHGMLNLQPDSYYLDLEKGELENYSTRSLTERKDFYFRLMYLRLVRALDYVTGLKQWDGKRVLVKGESQGGGQTAFLAGYDHRVTAAVLNVPAIQDLGGALQDRQGGWPGAYSRAAKSELGRSILPYFDGALLLRHTRAKLFYEAGLVDVTCNPACVFASFNNAGSTDKQIHTYPYRTHSGMNKRYVPEWKQKIDDKREQFIDDYLK